MCGFVRLSGLTFDPDHSGCSKGLHTGLRFALLGVPTEYGDLGESLGVCRAQKCLPCLRP
jgi:hypothetical protein